jgi:Na+/melibiose symporter-like transporter
MNKKKERNTTNKKKRNPRFTSLVFDHNTWNRSTKKKKKKTKKLKLFDKTLSQIRTKRPICSILSTFNVFFLGDSCNAQSSLYFCNYPLIYHPYISCNAQN